MEGVRARGSGLDLLPISPHSKLPEPRRHVGLNPAHILNGKTYEFGAIKGSCKHLTGDGDGARETPTSHARTVRLNASDPAIWQRRRPGSGGGDTPPLAGEETDRGLARPSRDSCSCTLGSLNPGPNLRAGT